MARGQVKLGSTMKTTTRFRAFRAVCLIVGSNSRTECFSSTLLCLAVLCYPAAAQTQRPGRIIGHIDGVAVDIGGAHVKGWACQQGLSESITVHIYANGSAYDRAKGTLVLAGKADLDEEAAVDKACEDTIGRRHRFDIPIPGASLLKFHGMPLYVHGIRVVGNVENAAISGSGITKFPAAPRVRQKPSSYPRLSGQYTELSAHPRVFDTQAELEDIAKRASKAGTYSNGRYGALGERVRKDMTAKVDWDSTYAGCDMEIYLRAFSYEQNPAYGNDRTEDQLRKAMNGRANLAPPHGAAIVVARAALYAALVKAGAPQLPGAPSASDAAAFARRILLAWVDHGFRYEKGAFRLKDEDYCDLNPDGTPHVTQFGRFVGALTLTRGVIYSVDAQDLLEGADELTHDENARLDGFHHNMFDTIHSIHNQEYDIDIKWKYSDEIYNNQFAGHLTALLALSRLFDDKQNFEAALDGGSRAAAVKLPWIELFDGIIYGENDTPWLNISPNSSVDPAKSHPAYSTAIVAAGEVNDRYRHANAVQSFGYATGSLEGLYMAAEIMKNAGFDAYPYRGAHGQSLEMASRYYGCFAKSAGFEQTVTAENSRACPDAQEYFGGIVNGVEPTVLIGAYRFPKDSDLAALDGPAKSAFVKSSFSIEPIMFGKWLH
jgi:hypothetical protein